LLQYFSLTDLARNGKEGITDLEEYFRNDLVEDPPKGKRVTGLFVPFPSCISCSFFSVRFIAFT
jgi:hypothetical protein